MNQCEIAHINNYIKFGVLQGSIFGPLLKPFIFCMQMHVSLILNKYI